jgi:TolB-like protein/DNA-binding winged helix-turn-helix (wHTH) protein
VKKFDNSRGLVRFKGFQLDLRAGELHADAGKTCRLPEQPFQILTILLQHPGEVLTREDIRNQLWPTDTNVEFEHSINAAMNRLRQTLGDSAENPLYIETLPRRGYRFVGEVDWSDGVVLSPFNGEPAARRVEATPGVAGEVTPSTPLSVQDRGRGKRFRRATKWTVVVAALLLAWPLIKFGSRWKTPPRESVQIRSIAVLPFENLSGDPAQDYFADGMTDELITTLAKNHELRIISRTSVMQYRTTRRPIREIARELGVDGVIEGSVVRSGNRIRIAAQLIPIFGQRVTNAI